MTICHLSGACFSERENFDRINQDQQDRGRGGERREREFEQKETKGTKEERRHGGERGGERRERGAIAVIFLLDSGESSKEIPAMFLRGEERRGEGGERRGEF